MTDRELLELAAKAAGVEVIRSRLHDPLQGDMLVRNGARNPGQTSSAWNPLTDDGDALRLAVKLRLDVFHGDDCAYASNWRDGIEFCTIELLGADPCAATRRAIVRAAAEIGRGLAEKGKTS